MKLKTEFTDREHRKHCRLAGCWHPAVHPCGVQGWCALCRAVAFRGSEGLAWAREEVLRLEKKTNPKD